MSSIGSESDTEESGEVNWNRFAIDELRNECDRRGLPSQGSKRELIALLQQDQQKENDDLGASDSVSQAGSQGSLGSARTLTQTTAKESSSEKSVATTRGHEPPQNDENLSQVSTRSTSSRASLRELDAGAKRAELAAEEELQREIRRKKFEME